MKADMKKKTDIKEITEALNALAKLFKMRQNRKKLFLKVVYLLIHFREKQYCQKNL